METIRRNITDLPYSLHDMRVSGLSARGDGLTFLFENGFEEIAEPCIRVSGKIRFMKVDWDFSFAYVLDFAKNEGPFSGQKYFLSDFVSENPELGFEIVDETYGYNQSKFAGYISAGEGFKECVIEIYHFGDMVYVTEEK